MDGLRHLLMAGFCLYALSTGMAQGAEPEPGKVRLVRVVDADYTIRTAQFTADGNRLATTGGLEVSIWDPNTGKKIAGLTEPSKQGPEDSFSVAVSPDGKLVAASFRGRTKIVVIDAGTGAVLRRITDHHVIGDLEDDFPFGWLACSPDGRTLAALLASGGAQLWDMRTGKESVRLKLKPPIRDYSTRNVAFSPDGATVAVSADGPSIRFCDPTTGEETRRLPSPTEDFGAPCFAFSPDGKLMAVAAPRDGVIEIWDIGEDTVLHRIELAPPVTYADFAAEFGIDPKIDLRSLRPGLTKELAGMHKYPIFINAMSFSPDGRTLGVSAYRPECIKPALPELATVQLWEVATGNLRHHFKAHVAGLAFRPRTANVLFTWNGYELAHGGRLWDWRDPCLDPPSAPGEKQLDSLWEDLAANDAAKAYRAQAAMLQAPRQAVEALAHHVRPIETVPEAQVEKLLARLDGESFSSREKAFQELADFGEAVRPALRRALKSNPSEEVQQRLQRLLALGAGPLTPQQLRGIRAVEVLECIGSTEANEWIAKLAQGVSGAAVTEDARAALKRLRQNSSD